MRRCWRHVARVRSGNVEIAGTTTRVLVEQLGELAGHLAPEEKWSVDEALATVLSLR